MLIDSDDYHNVVKELINKIKSLVSVDDIKLNSKLNFIKQRFNKIIEFQKGKYKLQENGCKNIFITKSKIIKCAIETDYSDSKIIHNLINKVWQNPYTFELFTFLSTAIAENDNFLFYITNKLNHQVFGNHVEIHSDFRGFMHESYHVLQKFMFDGYDFFNVKTKG